MKSMNDSTKRKYLLSIIAYTFLICKYLFSLVIEQGLNEIVPYNFSRQIAQCTQRKNLKKFPSFGNKIVWFMIFIFDQ